MSARPYAGLAAGAGLAGMARKAAWPVSVTLGAAVAGVAAAAGGGIYLVALGVVAAGFAVGIASWRRSVVCLLLYLPVSGLIPLALYPHTGPGVLLKDVVFVVPAYLGALGAAWRRRESFAVPGAPVAAGVCLVALIVVQAFNPHLTKPLVGAIGVKVWLFYIPLVALGYQFGAGRVAVQRLLKWMLVVAMIPCVLGIFEAILIYNGHAGAVYHLYGSAAAAATQDYTTFDFGLTRIPSIFTFVSQYWLFSTATVALGYAAWRGDRSDPTLAWLGPLGIAVAVLASMSSGARAAFIFTPFLLLMIVVLDGARAARLLLYGVASVAAVGVSLAVLGIGLGPLAGSTTGHGGFILSFFGQGLRFAAHHATWGLGTGVDTSSVRYAYGGSTDYGIVYRALGGVWYESWYLKAYIELGLLGLLLLLGVLGSVLRRSLICHLQVRDPELRSISAALVALLIWISIYCVKTAYIDYDPFAVYAPFFLGLQWRLRTLDRA